MGKKQNKVITLRVTEEWAKALDGLATTQYKKKSDVLRAALNLYYLVSYEIPHNPVHNSVFGQDLLEYLFKVAPVSEMKNLADRAYRGGMKAVRHMDKINSILLRQYKQEPESVFKILTNFVFDKEGQHWFRNASYSKSGNTFTFTGEHLLGRNFYEFIKELFILYLADYDYSLASEKHEEIHQFFKDHEQEEQKQIIYSMTLSFNPAE